MKMHKNARLTPLRREEMARGVLAGETSRREAARSFGVTAKTVSKRVGRFRDLGPAGMPDRSSRPRRMRRPTPAHVAERIVHLRRHRLTGARIAAATGVPPATADRILKRAGLSRIRDLEPEEPARRCEHDNPGDMTRLDVKRFGRFEVPGHRATGTRAGRRQGSGWEYAHICVDDASRVACGGPCCTSRAFAAACRRFGARHVRTKPYTPRTNGGAERFIQTAMAGAEPRLGPARRLPAGYFGLKAVRRSLADGSG